MTGHPWRRLSPRVVWVDLLTIVVSVAPTIVAFGVVGVDTSPNTVGPLLTLAVIGILGAGADLVRWATTRYRVDGDGVERRSGLFVRRQRTARRDRIRSVDTHAKLRHRMAGLRVVTVGGGQQTGAGEAVFVLDALSTADAERLRLDLLGVVPAEGAATTGGADAGPDGSATRHRSEVVARFRPGWVVFNMVNIWAFVMAAGLLWGTYWLLMSFGVDAASGVLGAVDGWALWQAVTLGVVAVGVVGAIGLGVNFLLAYGGFELARVEEGPRSLWRTRRGLLQTREVLLDEARIRGISIGEPVLWRWMGMADTTVITTGLKVMDLEESTAILPRGPIRLARQVAGTVLGDAALVRTALRPHPVTSLVRRLAWAGAPGLGVLALLVVPVVTGAAPSVALLIAPAVWLATVPAACIAHRALGHAVTTGPTGPHLIVRSGLVSRTTSWLRCDAVSTVAIRRSPLQRRLGLCTVSAMTAAGWGAYEVLDIPAEDGVGLAARIAPDLVRAPAGARPSGS